MMNELDRIEQQIQEMEINQVENRALLDELRDIVEDIEQNILDGDNVDRDADFHEYQLMSFENHAIVVTACLCHKWYIRDIGLSLYSNMFPPIYPTVEDRIGSDPELNGCYFITSSLATMFSNITQVFMDRPVGHVTGIIIHVTDFNHSDFLKSICMIADLGVMPCEYIRKMSIFTQFHLTMYCPDWFSDLMYVLSHYYSHKMIEFE